MKIKDERFFTLDNDFLFRVLDNQEPSFGDTCPPAQNKIADRAQTTATVYWNSPTAEDNADGKPIVTTLPNVISPHKFPEGSHTVIYTATDDSGNRNVCYFKVHVQGST